ncbi:S-adenosyl-L-methionine-dependent methyltransferase [Plectosphaerella cucumerina]|uniref:S-adenosyl-L-methionine-dependent methyltransferase n=1 Tax=Plectosphaerella cucumerina TaxID=40658 RepID=A0A8K0TA78_9PEZI|nr:S-adenosyl-L-methionine-dependent methyltransferase [Plectosphaerella cucumerina]
MSLYHEAAEALSAPSSAGGSFKSRVFNNKKLKSPAAQVYALAVETCKWSAILSEVVDAAGLLRLERKLTPVLALLLTHDLLLSRGGVALPQSHGLRAAVDRHRARLTSELTRARIRRRAASLDDLRAQVDLDADPEGRHPRWARVNALRSDVETQLSTTFRTFARVLSVEALMASTLATRSVYVDEHVPNLVAVTPGVDLTKTEAYRSGALILQDKASCFPAYLLDPHAEHGDVIDSCAAPGNKTTHLAAIMSTHAPDVPGAKKPTIYAFERDDRRALTLEKMVKTAGSKPMTRIGLGQDFLDVDPNADTYKDVGALLLDPSCSGSGIVGRDSMPELHLPTAVGNKETKTKPAADSRKRKREDTTTAPSPVLVDDDGNTTTLSRHDLQTRLNALAGFQLTLLQHAMTFPSARRITYSTCSIHAEENEHVVLRALASDVARRRGWRVLPRGEQVTGMREWPVRGEPAACVLEDVAVEDPALVAEACIRTYKGDGRGVMGFFVAAFVRDDDAPVDEDGPYIRDDEGAVMRDVTGMPVLKTTGEPVSLDVEGTSDKDDSASSEDESSSSESWEGFDE